MVFHDRASDSALVERVWRAHSEAAGGFLSVASCTWELVVTRHAGATTFTLRGPETVASPADYPAGAQWMGIRFRPGAFLPHLAMGQLRDRRDQTLPTVAPNAFHLAGETWELPDFDDAEGLVDRWGRRGLIGVDRAVEGALRGEPPKLSARSIQRRMMRVTGLAYGRHRQIERARRAAQLLARGVPILDVAHEAGYFDQAHLTRTLGRLMGQTPARIARGDIDTSLSFLSKTGAAGGF